MQAFILKTILSFFIGGLWIAGTTQLAERFGTRIGGFIGGLPSTIVVSLTFIAWTGGPAQAQRSTAIIPYALTGNVIFLLVYVLTARSGVVWALITALGSWSLAQLVSSSFPISNYVPGFLFSIGVVWLVYCYLTRRLKVVSQSGITDGFATGKMLTRAVLGGSVVALSIILSRVSGALLAGIFAVFPAVAISTMWFSYRSGGVEFSKSIVPTFILSMVVNCGVYAYVFRLLVLSWPILWTALIAYLAAAGSGAVLYRYARGQLWNRVA